MVRTHVVQEVVASKVPSPQPLGILALPSCPRIPIRKWTEMRIIPDGDNHKECGDLDAAARASGGGEKIEDSAGG